MLANNEQVARAAMTYSVSKFSKTQCKSSGGRVVSRGRGGGHRVFVFIRTMAAPEIVVTEDRKQDDEDL